MNAAVEAISLPHTISTIIFDLDGTLVDFRFPVERSKTEFRAALNKVGIDTTSLQTTDPTQTWFDKIEAQLSAAGAARRFPAIRRKLTRILDHLEQSAFRDASPHPGVREVLRALRQRGYQLALLTNSGRGSVRQALRGWRLAQAFALIATRDDVRRLKPSPDGLQYVLQKLRVDPQNALYVGDSVLDVSASRAAAVMIASVPTGVHFLRRLVTAGPDYLLADVSALLDLLPPQGNPRLTAR